VKLKNIIMKHANNFLLMAAITMICFISCGNNVKSYSAQDTFELSQMPAEEEYLQNAPVEADEAKQTNVVRFTPPQIMPNFIATQAASSQYDDGVHKFIRTAKMKFKVKQIPQATQKIEDIIIKNKGFIINSTINNNPCVNTINISKDSALVIYYNNLAANLELRVPHQVLDSTLRQIAPLATLIDYRTVEARDVTVQLMSEKMKQERLAKKQQRMSNTIGSRSGKLEEAMDAEDRLDNALENADNAKLSEYTTNDQIAYSTIYINLYQDQTAYKEKVVRDTEDISAYEPGFGAQTVDALSNGWWLICSIALLLIKIWPIYIVLAIAAIIYFKVRKHRHEKD